MVRLLLLLLAVGVTATPAFAQAPADPAAPPLPPAEEIVPDEPASDPQAVRREALFDMAIDALASGDLDLAERAFVQAAALSGDATRSAVATSFAERVRRLRIARQEAKAAAAARRTGYGAPRAVVPAQRTARAPLVGVTTLLGLAVYGWTVPSALGIDDSSPRPYVGAYLLTAAASFAVPYFFTRRNADVTPGQVNLAWYGGTRGIWHGVFAGALIVGNISPQRRYRAWTTSMLLGSLVELGGGLLLADRKQMTAGQARTMGALGDFGLFWGIGSGYLLAFDEKETPDEQARGMAASALVGSAVGLTAGYFLARRRDNTWGDGEVLRTSGLLGALLGVGVLDTLDVDLDLGHRPVPAMIMSTSLLGLVAGDLLVRHTELTVGQSMLIDLSSAAGALGAAGVAYLLIPEGDGGRPSALLLATALGGIAGFGLSYWAFADDRPPAAGRRVAGAGEGPAVGLFPRLGSQGERGVTVVGTF